MEAFESGFQDTFSWTKTNVPLLCPIILRAAVSMSSDYHDDFTKLSWPTDKRDGDQS